MNKSSIYELNKKDFSDLLKNLNFEKEKQKKSNLFDFLKLIFFV